MKTKHIESTFRNVSKLAIWQSYGVHRRLKQIRDRLAQSYHKGESLADARRSLIAYCGPEMSAPETKEPFLWLSGAEDPEVCDVWAGSKFLDHRGWFTDSFQSETIETMAVCLKRFPKLVFYGVKSEGGIRVHLAEFEEVGDSIDDAVKEIIRSNDSTTEREAEESVEENDRWNAEQRKEEAKSELVNVRGQVRALIADLRKACPMVGEYPAIFTASRETLNSLLAQAETLRTEIRA